uniref:Uncharacterized protein n=1 Tax=Fagus sylvatica TaxID=28930 RepID=A0A2N9F7U1_FAGSY
MNCKAAKATTARPVCLTLVAAAALSPSPHSITPRLLLERGSAVPGSAQSQICCLEFRQFSYLTES